MDKETYGNATVQAALSNVVCVKVDTDRDTDVAQAYRDFRRLPHVLRLNDARYARVEPASVAAQREAVRSLWEAVLGTD
jgi:glutamate-ammonia-ligase adenylyltransferase